MVYRFKGEYDAAIRDYKKGQYLINSSKEISAKGSPVNGLSEKNSLLPSNYLTVFEKVWQETERIFEDMRASLFKQLALHSQSISVQEQVIR
jgi:hypothetical protein